MSRATMKLLLYDLEQLSTSAFRDLPTVEIVPRKMIEMIIEKCDRDIEEFDGESNIYEAVRAEARNIKNYALSLLEKFEEEPEEEKQTHCRKCQNCKHYKAVDINHCIYCSLKGKAVFGFESCDCWEESGKV